MGNRKRQSAEALKESKKSIFFAKLNNCPTSPRKMRLVADLIRGKDVNNALGILKFNSKDASKKLKNYYCLHYLIGKQKTNLPI